MLSQVSGGQNLVENHYTGTMLSRNLSRDLRGAGFSFRGTDVKCLAFAALSRRVFCYAFSGFAFADIVFHYSAVHFMSLKLKTFVIKCCLWFACHVFCAPIAVAKQSLVLLLLLLFFFLFFSPFVLLSSFFVLLLFLLDWLGK